MSVTARRCTNRDGGCNACHKRTADILLDFRANDYQGWIVRLCRDCWDDTKRAAEAKLR